jgi:hypothetical protein
LKVVGFKLYVPAVFTPRIILVLILRGWVGPGHTELSDAMEKISSDTTGDRFCEGHIQIIKCGGIVRMQFLYCNHQVHRDILITLYKLIFFLNLRKIREFCWTWQRHILVETNWRVTVHNRGVLSQYEKHVPL